MRLENNLVRGRMRNAKRTIKNINSSTTNRQKIKNLIEG